MPMDLHLIVGYKKCADQAGMLKFVKLPGECPGDFE
jgi:hypothetical protein